MSLVKLPKKSVEFFKKNQDEIINSGNLVEGAWNKTLNEKIKEISGAKNAVCINSNGSGLVAILLIFKTYFGREDVMIQSNTMYGVKTMVGTAGLNLVDFINCQIETLMPNYQDVENAVKNYKGDKNKLVIMLSDIGGIINPDIEKIAKFLKQENILLLEDAAHSFGARLNKKFSSSTSPLEELMITVFFFISFILSLFKKLIFFLFNGIFRDITSQFFKINFKDFFLTYFGVFFIILSKK